MEAESNHLSSWFRLPGDIERGVAQSPRRFPTMPPNAEQLLNTPGMVQREYQQVGALRATPPLSHLHLTGSA
jgi:hypothetical protein